MKLLLQSLLTLVGSFLPDELKALTNVARGFIDRIELPDSDPRWQQVYIYTAAVIDDVKVAREQGLTGSVLRNVRLVAENRFMHQLADLHLIERG